MHGRTEKEYDVRSDGYQACAQNGIRTYIVGLQCGYGVGMSAGQGPACKVFVDQAKEFAFQHLEKTTRVL